MYIRIHWSVREGYATSRTTNERVFLAFSTNLDWKTIPVTALSSKKNWGGFYFPRITEKGGKVSENIARILFLRIIDQIAQLSSYGIKLGNILAHHLFCSEGYQPLIRDFTKTDPILLKNGRLYDLLPEQHNLYQCGMLLYNLVSGCRPFIDDEARRNLFYSKNKRFWKQLQVSDGLRGLLNHMLFLKSTDVCFGSVMSHAFLCVDDKNFQNDLIECFGEKKRIRGHIFGQRYRFGPNKGWLKKFVPFSQNSVTKCCFQKTCPDALSKKLQGIVTDMTGECPYSDRVKYLIRTSKGDLDIEIDLVRDDEGLIVGFLRTKGGWWDFNFFVSEIIQRLIRLY